MRSWGLFACERPGPQRAAPSPTVLPTGHAVREIYPQSSSVSKKVDLRPARARRPPGRLAGSGAPKLTGEIEPRLLRCASEGPSNVSLPTLAAKSSLKSSLAVPGPGPPRTDFRILLTGLKLVVLKDVGFVVRTRAKDTLRTCKRRPVPVPCSRVFECCGL